MTRFFTTTLIVTAFIATSVIPTAASAAGDVEAGKKKFMELCVACHGESGKGDGPTGKALAQAGQPAPRDFTKAHFVLDTDGDGKTGTDADLKNVITKGAAAYGGSMMMAPIQGLSDQDLDNLIAFIRSLKEE
jgi:mono/diheme cytochrome c family protein